VPENEDRYFRRTPWPREEPSWFRVRPKLEAPIWKIRDVIRTTRAI
jgi:hypothetical protein